MLNKINLNPSVRFELQQYLQTHQVTLAQAMEEEQMNAQLAAIFHAGLPAMLKMTYSLEKMQTFFWTKRELLVRYLGEKLTQKVAAKPKKKRK